MAICSAAVARQSGDAAKALGLLKQLQSTQAEAGAEDVLVFILQGDIAYEVGRDLQMGPAGHTCYQKRLLECHALHFNAYV